MSMALSRRGMVRAARAAAAGVVTAAVITVAGAAAGVASPEVGGPPGVAAADAVTLTVTATDAVEGDPGSVVEVETGVTNEGPDDLIGGTVDFEVPEGAEIVTFEGAELEEGTRPEEGCALVSATRVECHTAATLPVGESNAGTFGVRIADDAEPGELGQAVVTVAADNGDTPASAETTITVAGATGDEVVLAVTATDSVEGDAGSVVEIETGVTNEGPGDLVGGTVDFEVPEGAEIVTLDGAELEEGERPDEGCALVSPTKLECHTQATLPAGESNAATFGVRIADDAAAGELGAAVVTVAADNGDTPASAETTITVAGDPEPTPTPTPTDPGDENGTADGTEDGAEDGAEDGTEAGTDDGGADENGTDDGATGGDDDLPDTGASDLGMLALAAGLLGVGGVAFATARRNRAAA